MKIYKIVDNTNENIYVGKTIQTLKRRLAQHKSHKNCSSRKILANEDYKIELIEETDDKTRERYWIENSNCINEQIPGRTDEERRKRKKETRKEYDKKNKDKKKQCDKRYRDKNKEYRKSWGEHNNLLKIDIDIFS